MTALSRISVGKKGAIYGDVICRSLSVQPGARLQGHFVIDSRVALKPKELAEDEV